MKADRIGTPTEQARANAGWLTPSAANRGRRAGEIPSEQSCATCHWIIGAWSGRLCARRDSIPVRDWATWRHAWCPHWTPEELVRTSAGEIARHLTDTTGRRVSDSQVSRLVSGERTDPDAQARITAFLVDRVGSTRADGGAA